MSFTLPTFTGWVGFFNEEIDMLYELLKTSQKEVDKVWGKEYWIINDQDHCGKIMILHKQHRCSVHYHKDKKETFFVISGKMMLEMDGEKSIFLSEGDHITINPYMKHRFTGITDCEFIEFSSSHSETDSYRDTKSEKVSDEEWNKIMQIHFYMDGYKK